MISGPLIFALQGSQRRKREKGAENISENFSNQWKEIATGVQEAQRIPYRMNPKRNTPRHIVIKMEKIKDKKRILKAARERQQVVYKGNPIKLSADFTAETAVKRGSQYILSDERETPINKNSLPGKDLIQIWWRGEKVLRKAKAKRDQHQQTSFTKKVKQTSLSEKEKATIETWKLWKKKKKLISKRKHAYSRH